MAASQKAETTVRIFLAAPARDTQALREVIEAEIERIRCSRLTQRLMRVELIRWDDETQPIPMSWLRPPQEAVNHFTGGPSSCDLVIGVFRHVFGSELDASRFGTRPDGQRWACTEWELYTAAKAAREGLVGDVLIFQDMASLTRRGKTPAQYEADEAELKRVTEFIGRARQDGCANRGVHEFEGEEELAQVFPGLLDSWLDDYLSKGKSDRPATLGHSAGMPPTFDLRPYLLRRSEQWRTSAGGRLDRRFVNLKLMVDHGLEHDGPRHEVRGEYDRLADLLAERQDVGAWVLVGDPGSGKSTILQHHEMTTAEAALAVDAGSLPEVCVWRRLSEYGHDSAEPAAWLAQHWPRDLPPLEALRGVVRVRFLLDGINEIKAPDRARQLEAIDRWTAWAAQQAGDAAGDVLAPIFSVRTLDQSPLSTNGFEVHQVVVARWTRDQIRAYCDHTLGEGNALWPVIEKEPSLLDLSALPFNLWAQCELFRALGRAATDRAELMGGMFWQMLAKRVGDAPLKVAGLLGEPDRQSIASGKWKQMLRALPEKHGCLVPWLDETMQRLHRLGRQVSVAQDDLLAGLDARPGWATPAQWLYAVRSLELIGEGGADTYSTDPLLRCTHQLWQEFFAARGLRLLPTQAPERLPDLRPPALAPLDEVLAKLGVQEPLPGPDPSHWEEPVKLAVQLVRDPLPWVRALEAVNLALAGRAAVACREKAEALHGAAVFDGLRQALLARSRDAAVDVRLRIEAGLVLGDLGDPRYEKRKGPHGLYLWPKQWVRVPAGRYTIGHNDGPADEGPETSVTLAAFEMAFAPVTNAEYRCFIDAGGYKDERWWDGELARQWLREGIRNEAQIELYRGVFARLRQDCEGTIASFNNPTESLREWSRSMALKTESEHAELLDQWYGARTFDVPQEWNNPAFNAAAQPVVGLCQFEANAYATWLAVQTGRMIRLPVEAEWEAATRWGTGRRWAWGDSDPGRWQMNADPAHLRRTSPIGVFVEGDTPEGLSDMAGNVWEWTTSEYTDRLEGGKVKAEAPDGMARRVLRGGSWVSPSENCRASFRLGNSPVVRTYGLGLRLVLGPIQSPVP